LPHVEALRDKFAVLQPTLDPSKLVFIDESGSNVAMTPDYAWAPRGQRVHDWVPRNRGTVTTMVGAMALTGLLAIMTVEGGTDEEVFEAFVRNVLVPKLQPGHIVVMDNVGAHKCQAALARIEQAGASVLFLPPYSPELNPIEEYWSKLKHLLKKFGARTRDDLDFAIACCIERITSDDAAGWFRHAGYRACHVN
jgi:transposase